MSLKINLYKNTNTTSKMYGLTYGRVEHGDKIMEIPDLADHIASHGSIYTKDVILGVLTKMASCMKELMLDGKKIKLADIAIFSAEITSKGAASYLAYDLSTHVKRVRLTVRGTGDASIAEMTKAASLSYSSLAEKLRDDERPKPEPEPEGDDDDDNNG